MQSVVATGSLVLDGDNEDKLLQIYQKPQTAVHNSIKRLLPFMVSLHDGRPETTNTPTSFYWNVVSIISSADPSSDRELWAASCP